MPRGIYERHPRNKDRMYCRSFYVRKDGTMYVQAGHDRVSTTFADTEGKLVRVPIAGGRDITGLHTDTKKCGIVVSDWSVSSSQKPVPELPSQVVYRAGAFDEDEIREVGLGEILGNRLTEDFGFCHNGFSYEIGYNAKGVPTMFVCFDIHWDTEEK